MLFAPRISPRLLAAIVRLARSSLTPAEITRRLGTEAERRGLPRPSYEQVRVLVREARRGAERAQAVGLELTFLLAVRTSRPASAQPGGFVVPLSPLRLLTRLRR